jgi:hypothetical protein
VAHTRPTTEAPGTQASGSYVEIESSSEDFDDTRSLESRKPSHGPSRLHGT